jgi:CRP-like cAMP-binding protein
MDPFDVLRTFLQSKGAALTDAEWAFIREVFGHSSLRAGEFMQRAGDVARHAAFVASGFMRAYTIDARGKEHVVHFAPETWWWADVTSLATGAPSIYFFEAVEDSELLTIDEPSHRALIERVPAYAAAQRTGLQRHAAAKDRRIIAALSASAEERYTDFVAAYPSIVQRVPQWMLASYLGVSPETVSRIRRNLSRR